MLKKIKLQRNELACFHYNKLTEKEREFIIFNIDAVRFLNSQINFFNIYTDEMLTKYPYTRQELNTLKSIIQKLDIFKK